MIERDGKGRITIVCTRGRSRERYCRVEAPGGHPCGRPHTKLCDWPTSPAQRVAPAVTCDAPLCDGHTFSPKPGVDYCPAHGERYRKAEARQEGEVKK